MSGLIAEFIVYDVAQIRYTAASLHHSAFLMLFVRVQRSLPGQDAVQLQARLILVLVSALALALLAWECVACRVEPDALSIAKISRFFLCGSLDCIMACIICRWHSPQRTPAQVL